MLILGGHGTDYTSHETGQGHKIKTP